MNDRNCIENKKADPSTEDTGRLMTAGASGGPKKSLILIIIAAVLIAAVAVTGVIIGGKNKRYDEQVSIAEKAFTEGNYQQAEIEYAAAVDMNKRRPKAREGLAYVYAVQKKYDDSQTVYEKLYEDTKEEKYLTAAGEVSEGRLPSDLSLMPARSEPDKGNNTEVYEAYSRVLSENEDGIKLYWWQEDINGSCPNNVEYTPDGTVITNEPKNKCVVIKDISGDGIPELMFFTADSEADAVLHVYTYTDDAAVEYAYDTAAAGGSYNTPENGGLFKDIHVAAGTRYIIYSGKEPGTFYIAHSMGDETMRYNSTMYRTDGDHISAVSIVSNSYGPNEDYSGNLDRYYINDKEVSSKEGVAAFGDAREDFGELLMLSGNDKNDLKVFEKGETQPQAAMTFNEAVAWLQQQS